MEAPYPLWIVLILLFIASIVFNEAVSIVNRITNGVHPLAAAEVAVGAIYTLFGSWLAGVKIETILVILLCFVASGIPMIIGDVVRWLRRIRK